MKDYISIDDVMSVFNDYMCGDVNEDDMNTFLTMLIDKAESEEKYDKTQEREDLGDYPDTIHDQFDNMTGSMNL